MKLFGIKTCDTCRKAWKWLDGQAVDYAWHDLREDGVDRSTIAGWVNKVGADRLINKRSTTWRRLPEGQRGNLSGEALIDLLATRPTLIKRPVFVVGDKVHVGFDDEVRAWLT